MRSEGDGDASARLSESPGPNAKNLLFSPRHILLILIRRVLGSGLRRWTHLRKDGLWLPPMMGDTREECLVQT